MRPERLSVVINDRAARAPLTGVGHYVRQLLRWLPEAAPEHSYHALYTRLGPRPRERRRPTVGDNRPRRPPWVVRRILQGAYGLTLRTCMRAWRADVYHEPNHIAIRWGGPTVTTIHDLSVLRHPEWHPADRVAWYEREFRRSLAQTRLFICPSEFTKNELMALGGIPAERIRVIPEAPREHFGRPSPEAVTALRLRFDLPETFLLYVGTIEPRKNLARLIEAYARLPARLRSHCPLVIAGAHGWGQTTLAERAGKLGVQHQIRRVGYVPDEELPALYAAASALVWPSWYEGFGLPPLECMACGTPVLVSDSGALPEVVGEAGIRLDPANVAAWTAAMQNLLEDTILRRHLAEAGRTRAARFSWIGCAQAHARVYEACADA